MSNNNLFRQMNSAITKIEKRSREIVTIVNRKMTELAGSSAGREFLTGYHGYECRTQCSTLHDWCEFAFGRHDVVNIACKELGDSWDDWEPDGSFNIHQMPYELWKDGTDEEIEAFITERFGEEAAHNKRNLLHSKYVPLFEFSPGKLIQIAGILADCGDSPYKHIDEIIAKIEALNEEA